MYNPPFKISLVWSWQPIELKSGDIPAPTLGVPHCAHPLWDKSALYTMLHLRNHTVYLPSVCPSHPRGTIEEEEPEDQAKDILD